MGFALLYPACCALRKYIEEQTRNAGKSLTISLLSHSTIHQCNTMRLRLHQPTSKRAPFLDQALRRCDWCGVAHRLDWRQVLRQDVVHTASSAIMDPHLGRLSIAKKDTSLWRQGLLLRFQTFTQRWVSRRLRSSARVATRITRTRGDYWSNTRKEGEK